MSLKKVSVILLVLYLIVAFSTAVIMTPEKIIAMKENKNSNVKGDNKNMTEYIAGIWGSKVVPEINDNAVDVRTVIKNLQTDPVEYSKKVGRRSNEYSPYNFIVKGKAKVGKVEVESSAGIVVLDIADISGEGFVSVQVGPVVKKSTIRDSLSFIHFNDFVNQIEFAKVSREINNYIRENVLHDFKDRVKTGDSVEFVGAFSFDKSGKVLITPIEIKLMGEK